MFIPAGLDVAKPRVLPEFKRLAHGLRSSNISVLDAKTFYIPNLHYDGAGPDAYFWVGNGGEPNIMGIKVGLICVLIRLGRANQTQKRIFAGSKRNGFTRTVAWLPGRGY